LYFCRIFAWSGQLFGDTFVIVVGETDDARCHWDLIAFESKRKTVAVVFFVVSSDDRCQVL